MASKEPTDRTGSDGPPEEALSAPSPGPTEQEIEDWAQRERERRRAWLEGPSAEERAEWARNERSRRRTELRLQARAAELARLGRRYGREGQLATEGAMAIALGWTRRTLDDLVRAGREWEDETEQSRQRVPLDEEDD